MSKSYTHTVSVGIGYGEMQIELSFTASPAIPEQGPNYASGGQPAEGGEIEIISGLVLVETGMFNLRKVEKVEAPRWLIDILQQDENVIETLFDSARDDIYGEADADYAAELAADMRREEMAS